MALKEYFFREKHFIVTSGVLLICIAIFLAFPAGHIVQGITLSAAAFIITPILLIKIVLKEPLSDWGLGKGEINARILMTIGLSFITVVGIFLLIHITTDFSANYAGLLPTTLFDEFSKFLLFQITIVLLYVILYEIFFRGFVLNLFAIKVGWWSVLVQFLIMTLVIFYGYDDQFLLNIPYLLVSLFAGVVAYITRSVYYSILFSFLLLTLFNSFIILTQ